MTPRRSFVAIFSICSIYTSSNDMAASAFSTHKLNTMHPHQLSYRSQEEKHDFFNHRKSSMISFDNSLSPSLRVPLSLQSIPAKSDTIHTGRNSAASASDTKLEASAISLDRNFTPTSRRKSTPAPAHPFMHSIQNEVTNWRIAASIFLTSLVAFHQPINYQISVLWKHLQNSTALLAKMFYQDH